MIDDHRMTSKTDHMEDQQAVAMEEEEEEQATSSLRTQLRWSTGHTHIAWSAALVVAGVPCTAVRAAGSKVVTGSLTAVHARSQSSLGLAACQVR